MDHHVEAAREVYRGRPWILATAVLASVPGQLAELRAVDVDDVLVLAGSHGTGAASGDGDAIVLGVIERADSSRTARCHVVVDRVLDSNAIALRRGPAGLEPTDDPSGDVIPRSGPAPAGGIVLIELADGAVPAGASVNPLVAEALGWADRRWALGLGVLEPAEDVRR